MEQHGPEYNIDSAALKKFRRSAKAGLSALSREERQRYGAAVEAAVLSAQRSALRRASVSLPAPNCASGTVHNTGEAIHAALRERQRAALSAYPSKVRRARSDVEWREMYEAAMTDKREREACSFNKFGRCGCNGGVCAAPKSKRTERAEAMVRAARARLQAA